MHTFISNENMSGTLRRTGNCSVFENNSGRGGVGEPWINHDKITELLHAPRKSYNISPKI